MKTPKTLNGAQVGRAGWRVEVGWGGEVCFRLAGLAGGRVVCCGVGVGSSFQLLLSPREELRSTVSMGGAGGFGWRPGPAIVIVCCVFIPEGQWWQGEGIWVLVSGGVLEKTSSVSGLVLRLWGGQWAGPNRSSAGRSEVCHGPRALGVWETQTDLALRSFHFG